MEPSKLIRMRKARSDNTRAYYLALGRKIAEARARMHMTQEALAAQIRLTRTSVVNIERGKQQLLVHTFAQIARVLNTEPAALLPDLSPDGQPLLQTISDFVSDRKGRAWIEKSLTTSAKDS